MLSSEELELCHRGGEEENQKEQRGAGGGAGPSKYQELEESGILKEKGIARRRNTTQDLSVVLGQDHMEHPAEGSLDATETRWSLRGKRGQKSLQKRGRN